MLCEFIKVLPDDLLEIPPNCDYNFCIDLESGTRPISIPLYKNVLIELKKLKSQLQDLLWKGFIHPSTSLWSVPVLFVKKKDSSM